MDDRKVGETGSQPNWNRGGGQPALGESDGWAGRKGKERRQATAHGISGPVGRRETDDPGWFLGGPITNPGPGALNAQEEGSEQGTQATVCVPD